ncbi:hypothetical protein ACRRTK_013436 [Alexandromys fortis]
MAGACSLGPLLVLLLAVVSVSLPITVVRLNKAMLDYVSDIGKVPLQRALQVPVSDFPDRSDAVLQSTRVQILDVHLPRLHLKFIAGFGIRLSAAANFTIKVFRVPEPMELMLPVALLADVHVARDSIGTLVLSISTCSSLFSPASTLDGSNRTSQELLDLVQEHIRADLSNTLQITLTTAASLLLQLCLQVSGLVQDLNVHLGTLIGLSPVGPESQIRYSVTSTPTITSNYMSMDVRNSKNNPLNTSMLGQLIPEVARQFPEPMPVVLKVQLGATPVVTLHTNFSTLQLRPIVEVLAVSPSSALQFLFSLDVMVNLNLQLSVSKAKLRGTTSMLGGLQLSVATSNVGSMDMDQVYTLISTVFQKPLLDHLNALLGMGIALPSVLNLHYVHSEVSICEVRAVE